MTKTEGVAAEKARRAVTAFRQLQPVLNSYARNLTGRRDICVEAAAQDNGSTDGKRIFYRPPIELGDNTPHNRNLCNKRDEQKQLICAACNIREQVLSTLYHEIAHCWHGSFDGVSDCDRELALREIVKERPGKYASEVEARIKSNPVSGYMELAHLINEFLPFLINCLEDARVNRELFKALPGTEIMFHAFTCKTFTEGVEQLVDGDWSKKQWRDYPLNPQIMLGVFCKASGYDYAGWFAPVIEKALGDEELTALVDTASQQYSVGDVFKTAFPILVRLRELGFCKSEYQPEDDDEDGAPEEASDQAGGSPSAGKDSSASDESSDSDSGDGSGGGESGSGSSEPSQGSSTSDSTSEQSSGSPSEDDDLGDSTTGSSGASNSHPEDSNDEDSSGSEPDPVDEGEQSDSGDSGQPGGSDSGGDGSEHGEEEVDQAGNNDVSRGQDLLDEPGELGSSPERQESNGGPEDTSGDPDSSISTEEQDNSLIDTGEFDQGTHVEGEFSKPDGSQLPMGTAEEVKISIHKLGAHEEKPTTVQAAKAEADQNKAIDKVIIQGVYFEMPSANISGVKIFDFDTNPGTAWNPWDRLSGATLEARGVTGDWKAPEAVVGPATLKARVVFSANARGGISINERKGKIRQSAIGRRAPVQDSRMFQRKTLPSKKSYFVLIGIDVSGSTIGQNLSLEKKVAMAQAELLNRLGIPFEIWAHSADWDDSYDDLYMNMYPIKKAEEPWNDKTSNRLEKLGSDSSNVDGHTLQFYRKQLDKRTETVKILCYYNDGACPAENYDEELEILQQEVKICKQKGYVLMGVGARSDALSKHGLETVRVDGVEDLELVIKNLGRKLA